MCEDDLAGLYVPQVEAPPVQVRPSLRGAGGSSGSVRPDHIEGLFLRGPIPLDWLGAAARLPGKALEVGLALWFLAGVRKRREGLKPTGAVLRRFGVDDRGAKSRALAALERAGLITLTRSIGRNPLVSIREGTPGER